jgi:predicted nucleic acid-binding protein
LTPVYFDANALVKRYVQEQGSETATRIFEAAPGVFTCKVAFAEVMATFRRKQHEGLVGQSRIAALTNQFQQDWEAITAVDLSPDLLGIVRRRAFSHPLRALDLLHLSAALLLRDLSDIPVVFVCSDQKLMDAARRELLDVFDPEREEPSRLE